MKKVLVTRSDFPESGIDLLKQRYDVEIWPADEVLTTRERFLEKVKGKDALFVSLNERIDEELLYAAGPNLKVVATMSAGVDHIDLDAAKKLGVRVGHTPKVSAESIAELAIGLLIATCRRFFEAHKMIVNGKWGSWGPTWMCGTEIKGKTAGIIGLGNIGLKIAQKLKALSVSTIYYNEFYRNPEGDKIGAQLVPLEELLMNSDFVIICCTLNSDTRNLLNEETLKIMKNTAILINVARGEIVDQDALVRALKDGTIAAAGLDVMVPEPLPTDHELLKLDNCVLLPHIGSASINVRNTMSGMTANNIIAVLEGLEMPYEFKK